MSCAPTVNSPPLPFPIESAPVPYVQLTLSPAPRPAPDSIRNQISNEFVVASAAFRTRCQSTTIHVLDPSVSVPMRTAPPAAGFRSVQNGAMMLWGDAALGSDVLAGTEVPPSSPPTTT